jgi:type I restriction enzyme R subunit
MAEHVVGYIYVTWRLPRPYNASLNDLLGETAFRAAVPDVVLAKLHLLRKQGNEAAHGSPVAPQLALARLREAFDIASWIFLRFDGGQRAQLPAYQEPAVPKANEGAEQALQKETKAALDKLAAQEAQLQKLLGDLDARNQALAVAEQAAAASKEALAALLAAGQKAANTLQLDELATRRRIIDDDLLAAGWSVGANGASADQVGQEVKLKGMPTASGEGIADYVLWGDDGKPLAVIEAKRAMKSAREGQTQASLYADCLEKKHGQRPVVFFTNGYEIYVWDDAQKYTPRKIHGFYSKDSLEYLIFQRAAKVPLATVAPALAIADRLYQLEAVKRVCERFGDLHRKALIVQATGTGKTRVAVSLCDLLVRAKWAKRILFLCDRRELLRQADRVFKEHLPGEPRVTVKRDTAKQRDKRIYLATYPAMMECFRSFDVGFFDLVIADESHRSIYNKYRDLFLYFDALQVGLTATPVKFVDRNTFELFGCENKIPTSGYSFDEAIQSKPPYLVPFRVVTHTTKFLREGIKYSQMSDEQRAELEAGEDHPELVEYDAEQVDRQIFNKDTTRRILRNLMEGGIREGTGSRVGKTIVFARSHKHAEHLAEVFEKTYPQYGGNFLRIIDNQEPRAEQLIDDFKVKAGEPTIAVSVDMLDTGIDVPEVVNLVFAKPVKSYVKFWQMIGRGTRLCKNLFGPGQDKSEFLIFDHWDNFRFFEEEYVEKDPAPPRSLLQQLFEARIALAEAALDAMNEPVFQATVDLLVQDIRDVRASKSIEVRDRAKELDQLGQREAIAPFAASTKADLYQIAAPLMQWRDVRGEEDAYRFDLLVTQLQAALLRKSPRVADLRARVEEQVELLMKNQNPVKAKAPTIIAVRSKEFWTVVSVPMLEDVRSELRGIMKYQQDVAVPRLGPTTVDVTDAGVEHAAFVPAIEGLALVEYRRHVESALALHFKENTTLYKVRTGKTVREDELDELARLVLEVDDKADLKHLAAHQPETRRSLLYTLRGLVGLDAEAVDAAFTGFVHRHPRLSAQQLRFLQLLKHYIAQNGGIEIDRLYQDPFTSLHAGGIDGVFTEPAQVDEIVDILAAFTPPSSPDSKRAS